MYLEGEKKDFTCHIKSALNSANENCVLIERFYVIADSYHYLEPEQIEFRSLCDEH